MNAYDVKINCNCGVLDLDLHMLRKAGLVLINLRGCAIDAVIQHKDIAKLLSACKKLEYVTGVEVTWL